MNEREFEKLKKELLEEQRQKELLREQEKINRIGFARGQYPTEEYQKILLKREKEKANISSNENIKASKFTIIAIIITFVLICIIIYISLNF